MPVVPAQPSWTRLVPSPLDPTLVQGLAAEVHDPLWMLTRQLQFGELLASDAGSPVWVGLTGEGARLSRYLPRLPDGSPGEPYDPGMPLECHVEAEPIGDDPLRFAALAGLRFLRLLEQEGAGDLADAYRREYPLNAARPRSAATRPFLAVAARGVPDGVALAAAITAAGDGVPAHPPVSGAAAQAVARAVPAYLSWYRALAGPSTPSAWRPERLEYQLSVGGPLGSGEAVFTAREYDEGRLDWSSFDLAADQATLGAAQDATKIELRSAGLPTPVTFRGQPAARFWEFEDTSFDLGDVSAAGDELSKMLFVEFALVFGNDHFVVPLDVDVGSCCAIDTLRVVDTFGRVTPVPHVARADADAGRSGTFRLFETGPGDRRSTVLLLPPVVVQTLDGPSVEDVRLLRDEGANLAWAVEALVSPTDGYPVEPSTSTAAEPGRSPTPGAPWRYRLRTPVPDNWFPLLPIVDRPGSVHLELGSVPPLGGGPAPAPMGRIVSELAGVAVPEEELTRSPTSVVRTWQYARWIDGTQHLWIGRSRRPVSPHATGDTGLRFDSID
ncbi:hypothetical protein [Blastococcus deserti]|uniref:Uncharacterized protein n=1 Tax=Blastococcus deserti TaxID=2259033 RepID=A0ABW4XD66_9ACTN